MHTGPEGVATMIAPHTSCETATCPALDLLSLSWPLRGPRGGPLSGSIGHLPRRQFRKAAPRCLLNTPDRLKTVACSPWAGLGWFSVGGEVTTKFTLLLKVQGSTLLGSSSRRILFSNKIFRRRQWDFLKQEITHRSGGLFPPVITLPSGSLSSSAKTNTAPV